MKVWIFVEGESDRIALNTLWANWRACVGKVRLGYRLHSVGWQLGFLERLALDAAEKLANNERDLGGGIAGLVPESRICEFRIISTPTSAS